METIWAEIAAIIVAATTAAVTITVAVTVTNRETAADVQWRRLSANAAVRERL